MKPKFVTNLSTCIALAIVTSVLVGSNFRSCNARSVAETDSPKKCDDVCLSSGCVHAASMVLNNMDPDVKPCDDFYKFACGGYIKSTVIPDNKNHIDIFSVIMDKIREQLRTSFESKIEDNERKPFRLVKNLYKSCMNTTAIEAQGLGPVEKILKTLGGWPVVDGDQWNDTDFHWISSIYKLHEYGVPPIYFIDFRVGPNFKNNTKNVIYINPGSLGLSEKLLLSGFNEKLVQKYYNYMVDIAVIFGANRERATVDLKESLLFEINLANISLAEEKPYNKSQMDHPMSISELRKNYPSIHWRELFGRLLPSSISVDDHNEIAIVGNPIYISHLEKLIAITPKKIQANYFMWRFIMDSLIYLNDDVRKISQAYRAELTGENEHYSRWKECVVIVSYSLPISVSALYVRKHLPKETKNNVEEIEMNIRKQIEPTVNKIEWMDEKTRKSALKKMAAMTSHIAHPNELLDDNKLEEFYAKCELSGGNYLESALNMTRFKTKYLFGKLRKPVNKTDWIINGGVTDTQAMYSTMSNSIKINAGILQGAFFSNDRPRYMNYGAIGFIIGHEITHGFDSNRLDMDGNLVDLWTPSTDKKYLQHAQCIIHQYGNYTSQVSGMKLNGTFTQSENIADNGGVKLAYYAYNNWAKRNSPEAKLPGLPYTPKQMFWISAANMWCSVNRREDEILMITTDVHSPPEFRILGALSNSPEFAKDFNCPIDSKMNPKNKCSVW